MMLPAVNQQTSPEDEVNEFLERAIDARSVEQLKKENVHPIFLKFYKKEFEIKVCHTSVCHTSDIK